MLQSAIPVFQSDIQVFQSLYPYCIPQFQCFSPLFRYFLSCTPFPLLSRKLSNKGDKILIPGIFVSLHPNSMRYGKPRLCRPE